MPKTGMYVLQGVDPVAVAVAPFDVKVIDVYNDNGQLFTAAQVQQMGGGAGNGLLLGYFSIGEAEDYRDYFQTIPSAAIGPVNPDWPGNYQVAYWTSEWKTVATAYLDKMIKLGYDGIYLDVVDEYQQAWAVRNAPGGDAEGAMVSLIKYLDDYAHAQNANFKIWANNAEELLNNATYLQTIDGLFKEELFYTDNGSPQPAGDTKWSLDLLHKATALGKDVIAIEYVSGASKIADIHAKAAAAGVGSYIAHLDLDGIDMEGVLPGQTIQDGGVPPPVTTGSGSDTLVLGISEDAYNGDAQFTVSLDGKQLGGTFTATASHASGISQSFTFKGDWPVGMHALAVNFLNDASAGTVATDRNLYVNSISYDGANTNQSATILGGSPKSFSITDNTAVPTVGTTPSPVTTGSGSDTLVLRMSEDAYQGDAKFTVAVDGKQLAGTFTATAPHATGATQSFTFKGDWAAGAHTLAVNFLNDAYGGTTATDRNLYVNAVSYNGTTTGQSAALTSTGPKSFSETDATAIPSPATGSGADTLVLGVSEDAYLGNAQFTVAVDGKQLGGTFTTTALHASGASQPFTFKGDFGAGQHAVAVKFLNDAYAGTAATDRNLYVNGVTYNGTNTNQSAALKSVGAKTFAVSGGTTPAVTETGDHGSLQKSLSQTGTYTVGGDTFVLSTGNAAAVTLGTGASQIKFIGASAVTLTGGSGQAVVTADAGSNRFVAGTGSLDVTGGGGKDGYVFHANSGLLTLQDFSLAKGDTLTVDKALQGSLQQTSDGQGGTMLSFGTAGHGVDVHGIATLPTANILWA
jgi:uncharacterized protein (TIGR01370 family)